MGELGVKLTVTVGYNLEGTSLLVGGSLLLLGTLLLAGVEVFESFSSGCLIRLFGLIDLKKKNCVSNTSKSYVV